MLIQDDVLMRFQLRILIYLNHVIYLKYAVLGLICLLIIENAYNECVRVSFCELTTKLQIYNGLISRNSVIACQY